MPPVLGRYNFCLRAYGLGHNRIHRKCMLTEHGIQARRQVGPRYQLQNVVGAVTQRHLIKLHAATLSQQALEGKTVAIRITRQFGQLVTNGLQRLRARTHRIFIAGQFDDGCRVYAQLSRQFVHRLARDVRRKLLYARLRQGEKITAHV